jgi:hypothetical protein
MKNQIITVLFFCSVLNVMQVMAQNPPPFREPDRNRPELFFHLPDTIPIELNRLIDLVGRPVGYRVNRELSKENNFPFEGEIIASVNRHNDRIQSLVIRAANYENAHFTFSKVVLDNGTIKYTGRILSFRHSDVFEVRKIDEGYFLIKRGFYEVVND